MRRGLGASSIFREKEKDKLKQEIGNDLKSKRESEICAELDLLKDKLRNFSAKFRQEISEDPQLCETFLSVCDLIGLDPLVSDKSVWEGIFGGGRFLPEVSVQLLAVCTETRAENGGVLELSDCVRRINFRRGGGKYANVNEKDVRRAVKELSVLGEGTIEIKKPAEKNPREFVVYAAKISDDVGAILNFLVSSGGKGGRKFLEQKFPGHGVQQLVRDGQVWVDGEEIFLPPNFS